MPPHCDALDGPVVRAAALALDADDVDLVLPYVPETAETEVRAAFDTTRTVRSLGGTARDVADRSLFETVVRLHRAGEGAAYTGLRPAGLDAGPVLPMAEKALDSGSVDELVDFLADDLRRHLEHRLDRARQLDAVQDGSVADARAAVHAKLGFQVYCHQVHTAIRTGPHEHA